jgi:hypothetical protein
MDWKWLREVEVLNNRETAIAIWLAALLAFLLFKTDVRKSLAGLIRSFFAWKIFTSYLLSLLYTCIGIYLLYRLHGWTPHQLKDAVLWCTLALMKTLLRINQVNEKIDYFKGALKENLKFTLIIEFISENYTFSLVTELVLVPLLALLGAMIALAKYDKKYSNLIPVFNWMLILFGLASILHALYQILAHFGEFANADKLREFLLPPFLAIWLLPWLYAMSVVMRFETAFIRFNFKRMNKPLYRLIRRCALRHFLFDSEGLQRWTADLQRHDITNKADLKDSLARLSAMRSAEKNPPAIAPVCGWSPYAAKDFLKDLGIDTRFYENLYDEEWGASSPYIKLDEKYATNYLTYSIEGSQHAATELNLSLSINNPANEKPALIRFKECAISLLHKSGVILPADEILKKINNKKNWETANDLYKVTLLRHDYLNDTKQYSYTFTIAMV